MDRQIKDSQNSQWITLPPVGLDGSAHQGLSQNKLRKTMEVDLRVCRIIGGVGEEELAEETEEGVVVSLWVWVEEIKVDVDGRWLVVVVAVLVRSF